MKSPNKNQTFSSNYEYNLYNENHKFYGEFLIEFSLINFYLIILNFFFFIFFVILLYNITNEPLLSNFM